VIQALNLKEIESSLSIGSTGDNHIPVNVSIDNIGYEDFKGSVVIEAGDVVNVMNVMNEEQISVSSGGQFNGIVELSTTGLTPGTREVKAYLYDESGELLKETSAQAVITGPDIKLVDYPENLEIDAGGFTEVTLKIKNEGHLRGEAIMRVTAFDSLDQDTEIALDPGEEIEVSKIYIDAAGDIPSGNYPFNYTLRGSGVENGLSTGNFSFKVAGVSLDVDASFANDFYNVGETAELALSITTLSPPPNEAPLEAMVNWGAYSEKRSFDLSSGSHQLVFNIPVDKQRDEKVFYGIYHRGGKGIHLNDIYMRLGGDAMMVLDKQVYAPGEVVHAVFTAGESGELTAEAFGESYTLDITSPVSVNFSVHEDTLGGTYGINWSFMPSATRGSFEKPPLDPAKLLSGDLYGSHLFDVSGLVVKVAGSELEKGKYTPGETIKATYTFESNRDETLVLRCWVTTPTGEWEYLGESSVTVSAERHVNAVSSYGFNTTEAGTHHLVYGLYKEDQLVVSGRLAFDVGDAVLMGITTDRFEYKEGNENVNVKIDYFGEGTAQLELFLDGEKIQEQSLTLSGVGSTEISLISSSVGGGSHSLKVVLTKDGLTSTKTTGFIYGTYLPDLSISLMESLRDGLNYTYKVEVTNSGKTTAAGTTLVFTDNETTVETVSIPSLQPDTSHEHTFQWSGSGKAGTHEFVFAVDTNNTVKEFSETNNQIIFSEEVPALFYSLEVEPVIYPANTNITIITRLINNRETPVQLTLDLSLTNDSTGEIVFQRNKVEELTAFGSKAITDTFNTGVYLSGEYTLSQTVTGDNADKQAELSILIETTKAMTATLQLLPLKIPSGTDTEVELTMTLNNTGNVSLEDEAVEIEVFNKDTETVVKTEEMLVSLAISEQKEEKKVLVLNLVEGNYDVRLKYLEEIIASAELVAMPPIKPDKIVGVHPRVLIMNLHPLAVNNSQVGFLTAVLQSQGIEHDLSHGILESYVKFHQGHSNVNIVLGSSNMVGRMLRDELRERVWRGEGLIFICTNPMNAPDLTDWLGVTVKPISGKERETFIELLPGEFTTGGNVELLQKNRLMIFKEREDVKILGQTRQKKQAVISYRKYGSGHILVVTVPLEFKSGVEHIAQLLVNAVTGFSKDIYTLSILTRVIPVEISLKNEGGEEKTIIVKELLPYGVEGYDYDPEPGSETDEEELKWNIKVPAASTVTMSYWLKLPDRVNSYDVKTELYEGETKLEEVSLTFEVSQTVLSRLDELILELENLEVNGKDARSIRKAKHRLEKIRNRSGDNLLQLLINLDDSVKAANYLGEVKQVEVSAQRLKTQDIMTIMGRAFYEKIKTWSINKLHPFLNMIKE